MKETARIIVEDYLAIKKDEGVLIIVDEISLAIGQALFDSASNLEAEVVLAQIIEREASGMAPPLLITEAMKSADVIIVPTAKALSNTKAFMEARRNGARIVTMPGITEEILSRTMSVDYIKLIERSTKLRDLLSPSSNARLTSSSGTDLTFFIAGREAISGTGTLHKKGSAGNLPSGEVCIAPLEGKTFGFAVIDASMAGIGTVNTPIKMIVKDGYVTQINGGNEARTLSKFLADKGKKARNIAELGIGINDKALLSGNILEDEKVLGTVHIGLGTSSNIGGNIKASVHLDGVMKNPTLAIDGKTVIRAGKHLI